MLKISNTVSIPESEIEISAIRSQGAGGQNVNKVASAVHLRFDIRASSLPDFYKDRLLHKNDHRITKDGVVIIKAQEFRVQEKNKEAALRRLQAIIRSAGLSPKTRLATRPTLRSKQRRMERKIKTGATKRLRRKIEE